MTSQAEHRDTVLTDTSLVMGRMKVVMSKVSLTYQLKRWGVSVALV